MSIHYVSPYDFTIGVGMWGLLVLGLHSFSSEILIIRMRPLATRFRRGDEGVPFMLQGVVLGFLKEGAIKKLRTYRTSLPRCILRNSHVENLST